MLTDVRRELVTVEAARLIYGVVTVGLVFTALAGLVLVEGGEVLDGILLGDIPEIGREGLEDKILTDQILFNLSEDDREILRLRYIADLPLSDIARVLNLNFVTVRVRVHRALARARAALDSQNHESYK